MKSRLDTLSRDYHYTIISPSLLNLSVLKFRYRRIAIFFFSPFLLVSFYLKFKSSIVRVWQMSQIHFVSSFADIRRHLISGNMSTEGSTSKAGQFHDVVVIINFVRTKSHHKSETYSLRWKKGRLRF